MSDFMTGGSLDRSRYSSEFWDFITDCLIIRYEERPCALDLLSYPVFRRAEIDYLHKGCKDSMTLSSEMILEIEIMRAHGCKTRLDYFKSLFPLNESGIPSFLRMPAGDF